MSHCHHHHHYHRRHHHERRHFGLIARLFGHRFCHHEPCQCQSCTGNVIIQTTTGPLQTSPSLNPNAAPLVSASAPVAPNVQPPYPANGYPSYQPNTSTTTNVVY